MNDPNAQWTLWMRASLDGDKAAYHALLTALQPWLQHYFAKRLPVDAIPDLVQETLMTVHEKRHTYDPTMDVTPWIATIAKHRWVDHLRRVYRRNELSFDEDLIMGTFDADATVQRDVMTLLAQLPPAQARVIDLVKLQEQTMQQAANQTGHSVAAVKVMVHRGMKKLATLAKQGGAHDA